MDEEAGDSVTDDEDNTVEEAVKGSVEVEEGSTVVVVTTDGGPTAAMTSPRAETACQCVIIKALGGLTIKT